jgi:hypothetical protein
MRLRLPDRRALWRDASRVLLLLAVLFTAWLILRPS